MLTNQYRNVLYVGVTSDLEARMHQHRNGWFKGFSSKYRTHILVWYEAFDDITYAIEREKQIKRWRREKKNRLIEIMNPFWDDLYESLYAEEVPQLGLRPRSE